MTSQTNGFWSVFSRSLKLADLILYTLLLTLLTWHFKGENQLSAPSSSELVSSALQLAIKTKCFISVCLWCSPFMQGRRWLAGLSANPASRCLPCEFPQLAAFSSLKLRSILLPFLLNYYYHYY